MIKTLDIHRNYTAVLENAYDISYEKEVNQIWTASFSLPINDPKIEKIEQFGYVEIVDDKKDEYIGLFRVMPIEDELMIETDRVTVECYHVISTLMDSVIAEEKGFEILGRTTRDALQSILSLQNNKDWILDRCDFVKHFNYGWEIENGLADPLFSIPLPINEPYEFTYDTTSYPWKISLVKPDTAPICRIDEKYNLQGLSVKRNPMEMFNEIIPYGVGEGVSRLNIKRLNGGKKSIRNEAAIQKNGGRVRTYVWVDRRFTREDSLLNSGKSLLERWSEPIISWSVNALDVSSITGLSIDRFQLGKIVNIRTRRYGVVPLRIIKMSKSDITGDPGSINLELGNAKETFGGTLADSDRQIEINTNYANGAPNIFYVKESDNCDDKHGIKLWIHLDEDVAILNQMKLDVETSSFRGYTKAVKGGGAMVGSTASGGHTASSTSSGGGSVQGGTSQAGGATQVGTTSSASGDVRLKLFDIREGPVQPKQQQILSGYGNWEIYAPSNLTNGSMYSHGTTGVHTHSVNLNIPAHNHSFSVNIPPHTHSFSVPAHSHNITLPDHTHAIEFGIFEHSDRATALFIKVDGKDTPFTNTTLNFVDIIPYLDKDDSGIVTRTKHSIEIVPNKLARISAQVTCRVFIQSKVGGEF